MTIEIATSVKQLLEEANAEIETLPIEDAIAAHTDEDVVVVDLRDIRELAHDGKVPGCFHMPRGMLEFWIDPDSPYFKDLFHADKRFIFYCSKGWRSALAAHTAQRMGLKRVCHIDGGFEAWRESGGPIMSHEKKKPKNP
ncbi:MAG: rhodanese-like domain-containing protein [Gammaproteobacteria bacterium]|jgi:rhodanese-related sulfurtransferase|nr:rhodanese-like domain-containing protein [Gammaproteobacteria bacterium]NCF83271.1 rhodanese-like domain-containing protein [Pseudomonadota bacterium]